MLSQLRVKNYALIEEITMDFSPALNIITGETGTGKSILVGALSLVLGDRVDPDIVRAGGDRCIVEALFELPTDHPVVPELEALGVEFEESDPVRCLILRREVSALGKTQCRINDAATTLRTLKAVGDLLVDLHGQHEHQSLLDESRHVDLLDGYVGLERQVSATQDAYRELKCLREQLSAYRAEREALRQRHELESFQLAEIREAQLTPGEEEDLENERRVLVNTQHLIETARRLTDALYDAEDSISDRLGVCLRMLEEAAGMDEKLEVRAEAFRALLYQAEDLASAFRSYADAIEADPERLQVIEERLNLLKRLRKKHGGRIEDVIALGERLGEELDRTHDLDQQIACTQQAVEEARSRFAALCEHLSCERRRNADGLASQVEESLAELGMPNAKFSVALSLRPDPEGDVEMDGQRFAAGPKGLERVAFFLSANVGEPEQPLAKVASGGEVSRVMLSLKSTMAAADTVSTLIFDEIDIGISGRVAEAVGRKLRDLAATHQTISITHLPQIAKMGARHFRVSKEVQEGRTTTQAVVLNPQERAEELAKLLGGATISDITRKHAEELLEDASG